MCSAKVRCSLSKTVGTALSVDDFCVCLVSACPENVPNTFWLVAAVGGCNNNSLRSFFLFFFKEPHARFFFPSLFFFFATVIKLIN